MTITNTAPSIRFYVVTVIQSDWDFDFQLPEVGDLNVEINGITLTEGAGNDYTVFINGENGGTVTLSAAQTAALEVNSIIYLQRAIAYTRDTSYETTAAFNPVDVDNDMDRFTLQSAQVNDFYNGRAMVFPTNYTDATAPNFNVLPADWPSGFGLAKLGTSLVAVPISGGGGDPLLRAELAQEVPGGEGALIVGTTGETVQAKLESIDAEFTELADQASDLTAGGNKVGVFVGGVGSNVQDFLNVILALATDDAQAGANKVGLFVNGVPYTLQEYLNSTTVQKALRNSLSDPLSGANNVGVHVNGVGYTLQAYLETKLRDNASTGAAGGNNIGAHVNGSATTVQTALNDLSAFGYNFIGASGYHPEGATATWHGKNCTLVRNAVGRYTITLTPAFANTEYSVTGMAVTNSPTRGSVTENTFTARTAASFEVAVTSTGGTLADLGFSLHVVAF